MEWNKALNALIIVFIGINSLLGIANYNKYVKVYRIDATAQESIVAILNNKGIIVEAALPETFKPVDTVWCEPLQLEVKAREQLVSRVLGSDSDAIKISKEAISEPYQQTALVYRKAEEALVVAGNYIAYTNNGIQKNDGTIGKEQAQTSAAEFFNKIKLEEMFQNVKITYKIESYGMSVTYYELYNQLPIFDSYIRIEVTPEGVVSAVMQGFRQIEKIGTIKPLQPIDQVLFDIEEQIERQPPFTISGIELGYSMNNKSGMHILEEEALPVYKLEIKGLIEPVFVNAYTK